MLKAEENITTFKSTTLILQLGFYMVLSYNTINYSNGVTGKNAGFNDSIKEFVKIGSWLFLIIVYTTNKVFSIEF